MARGAPLDISNAHDARPRREARQTASTATSNWQISAAAQEFRRHHTSTPLHLDDSFALSLPSPTPQQLQAQHRPADSPLTTLPFVSRPVPTLPTHLTPVPTLSLANLCSLSHVHLSSPCFDSPTSVVDDLANNTTDVTVLLGKVEVTETGGVLVVVGVGLEDTTRLPLGTNDTLSLASPSLSPSRNVHPLSVVSSVPNTSYARLFWT